MSTSAAYALSRRQIRPDNMLQGGFLFACGFSWDNSSQGGDYWLNLHLSHTITTLRGRKRRKMKRKLRKEMKLNDERLYPHAN